MPLIDVGVNCVVYLLVFKDGLRGTVSTFRIHGKDSGHSLDTFGIPVNTSTASTQGRFNKFIGNLCPFLVHS